MPGPIDTVNAFIASWSQSKEAARAAFRDYFLPTTVWENAGASRTVGPDEAIHLSGVFEDQLGYETIGVDILHEAANGNVVFNERIDRLIDAKGRQVAAIRILGVFEIQDGKIAAWRDYFDASSMPGGQG